jgi:hypothetical protein
VLAGPPFRACRAGSTRVVRQLQAVARGRWRTVARESIATGAGSWATNDRCDGTLTAVQTGTVAVRDVHRSRTIAVHARQRALVRRQRGVSTTTGMSRSVFVWYSS